MFNNDQREYVKYLASLPADAKCKCKWYVKGDCPHCEPEDGGWWKYRYGIQCREAGCKGRYKAKDHNYRTGTKTLICDSCRDEKPNCGKIGRGE